MFVRVPTGGYLGGSGILTDGMSLTVSQYEVGIGTDSSNVILEFTDGRKIMLRGIDVTQPKDWLPQLVLGDSADQVNQIVDHGELPLQSSFNGYAKIGTTVIYSVGMRGYVYMPDGATHEPLEYNEYTLTRRSAFAGDKFYSGIPSCYIGGKLKFAKAVQLIPRGAFRSMDTKEVPKVWARWIWPNAWYWDSSSGSFRPSEDSAHTEVYKYGNPTWEGYTRTRRFKVQDSGLIEELDGYDFSYSRQFTAQHKYTLTYRRDGGRYELSYASGHPAGKWVCDNMKAGQTARFQYVNGSGGEKPESTADVNLSWSGYDSMTSGRAYIYVGEVPLWR